ncbi:PGG domain-containing protein [Tanacetum coccineum]
MNSISVREAHPDNRVGIVSYGHEEALLLGATNNLRGVSLALGDLKARKAKYTTNLLRGFEYSRDGWEQDMKRRMVVFTGEVFDYCSFREEVVDDSGWLGGLGQQVVVGWD